MGLIFLFFFKFSLRLFLITQCIYAKHLNILLGNTKPSTRDITADYKCFYTKREFPFCLLLSRENNITILRPRSNGSCTSHRALRDICSSEKRRAHLLFCSNTRWNASFHAAVSSCDTKSEGNAKNSGEAVREYPSHASIGDVCRIS